ncbi:MAG: HAD family phosphatase [Candidatus Acidiferrales bacterium]
MGEVTTLFWDMGGVILTNGWDRAARLQAVEKFHLEWEEFEDRHELLLNAFEIGEVTLAEYLQRTVFYRERSFTREEFTAFLLAQSKPFPESLHVLGEIAATNDYFLAALNNESLEINEYRIDTFHLRDYFDAFFSSCYLGVRKPDAGIYRRALSITHRMPAECIFIDDRGLNLECAKELGMRVIHFRNANQLRDALAEHGVVLNGK